MRTLISLLLLVAIGASYPCHSAAAPSSWYSAGVRGGLSADDKDHHLRQFEGFALYQLPWELRGASGWGVATQVEMALGVLNAVGEYGVIGSIGPNFNVGKPGFPLAIPFGISAAGLSRDTFDHRDYNGYGQFISHIGVDYRFSETLGVGYRFQHMSNAGLNGDGNPGVNMHLIGLSWYLAR